MTSRDFCYWLQGFFEIHAADQQAIGITEQQVVCIQKHLSLVFVHEIDPSFPASQQGKLNEIHAGKPKIGGSDENVVFRC